MYSLNNISLDAIGFIPGQQTNSNLALSGFLDLGSRLGKTFHDWADEAGIEPYVTADEIADGGFAGRDINLVGYIWGVDRQDCENKRIAIVNVIDSFQDLVPLVSPWGTNNVYINGPVQGEYLGKTLLGLTIPMREPFPIYPGIIPASTNAEFGIDGIDWKAFGATVLELSGDRRNRPGIKPMQFTAYGKESFGITKTVAPDLNLKVFIQQRTYALFKQKVESLAALFRSSGLRSITVRNDKIRSFFVKDGFRVSSLYSYPSTFSGVVDCTLTQSGSPTKLEALTINGSAVTINGDIITVKVKI